MCGSKLEGIHLPPSVGAVWGLPWENFNLGVLESAFKGKNFIYPHILLVFESIL